MKRKLFVFLVCFVFAFGVMPMSTLSVSIDEDTNVSDVATRHFEYPITSSSPEWDELTVLEKVEMLKIPQETLDSMTDEELIAAIAEYPYLVDIYLYGSSVEDGIRVARTYFSALDELLSRETVNDSLVSYGIELASSYAHSARTINSTDQTRDVFVEMALLDIIDTVSDITVVQEIEESEAVPYVTYVVTLKTPNGSDVTAYTYTEYHPIGGHATIDAQVVDQYGVTLVADGSCLYNCHAYAWYMTRYPRFPYWINDPSPFMEDGSYSLVCTANMGTMVSLSGISFGDVVYYANNTHSALFVDDASYNGPLSMVILRSKWGEWGVFDHTLTNVPAGYNYSSVEIWSY